MKPSSTLSELLTHAGLAIAAPDRPGLSYEGLDAQVLETGTVLNRLGLRAGDAVASVLPHGPEAATCFLGACAHAVAAPLNPAYTKDELAFYLTDMKARAVIVPADGAPAAREAATDLGILLLELHADRSGPAGTFTLKAAGDAKPQTEPPAWPTEIGMILHTSGTTAKPKMVPLTRGALMTSAVNIADTLRLNRADVSLTVMPLFHIHGLAAGLLAPLRAGGTACCPPPFNAMKVFGWLKNSGATWYSASPAMHRAILNRVDRNADIVKALSLRFVRSSSAPLPARTMADLERIFGCPAIEAYGMTEAAHQIASNPLPPRPRRPGSVGRPTGPEVAVMGPDGAVLPAGKTGEVVLRGETVMTGYLAGPEVNDSAFHQGWFRTGDLGALDEDGILTLHGRIKEIINRGGEKISPGEVDAVLMSHPAVDLAVTFAVPHETLGEDLAAALVPSGKGTPDAEALKAFARSRLAPFKVPRTIMFLDEIPKGPSGKVQRIGLAAKLGLA